MCDKVLKRNLIGECIHATLSSRAMQQACKYKFCRLCLCSSKNLANILEENSRNKFVVMEAVLELLQIKINKEENLPWVVCHSCLVRLLEFRDFKIRCLKSKMVYDHIFQSKAKQTLHPDLDQDKKKMAVDLRHGSLEDAELSNAFPSIVGAEMAVEVGFVCNPSEREEISSEQNSGDVGIEDDDIDYCWCVECHREFLNYKELKVHSEVCRGLEDWNHGKENGLTYVEEEREVPFEVNCADPGLSCARCKRNFRTRERLERHINKYDFKCMPKNVKNTEIDVRRAGIIDEEGVPLDTNQQENTCHSKILELEHSPFENTEKIIDSDINCVSVVQPFEGKERAIDKTVLHSISRNLIKITLQNVNGKDGKSKRASQASKSKLLKDSDVASNLRGEIGQNKIDPDTNIVKYTDAYSCEEKFPPVLQETHLLNELPSTNVSGERDSSIIDRVGDVQQLFKSAGKNISSESVEATVAIETGSYACDYCMNLYSDKSNLRSHILNVHLSLNRQNCPVCHKFFTNDDEFEIHLKTHPEDKKFFCTICEDSFFSRKILRDHIFRTHESKEAFVCSVCGNGFNSRARLGFHRSSVHSEADRKLKCTVCGKLFICKKSFRTHLRVCVLKSVSYRCDVCGKELSTKKNLEVHSLIHFKVKKFQCPICSKLFTESGARHLHIRMCHFKMRPYICGICNKTFGSRGSMMMHYKVHSDMRPYKCGLCFKAYKGKGSLKNHFRCFHGMQANDMNQYIVVESYT